MGSLNYFSLRLHQMSNGQAHLFIFYEHRDVFRPRMLPSLWIDGVACETTIGYFVLEVAQKGRWTFSKKNPLNKYALNKISIWRKSPNNQRGAILG